MPRTLGLMKTEEGIRLTQEPVKEIQSLRDGHVQLRNATWDAAQRLLSSRDWPNTLEIDAVLQLKGSQDFGFFLRKGNSFGTLVGFDGKWDHVYVDRTHSGEVIVGPTFAGRHDAPITVHDGHIRLHILLDRSSVELFAENGLVTMTDLIYPRESDRGLGLYSAGNPPSIISLDVWTLKPQAEQH